MKREKKKPKDLAPQSVNNFSNREEEIWK